MDKFEIPLDEDGKIIDFLSDDRLDTPLASREANVFGAPVEDDHTIATSTLRPNVLNGATLGKTDIAAGVRQRLADRLHAGARAERDGLDVEELSRWSRKSCRAGARPCA